MNLSGTTSATEHTVVGTVGLTPPPWDTTPLTTTREWCSDEIRRIRTTSNVQSLERSTPVNFVCLFGVFEFWEFIAFEMLRSVTTPFTGTHRKHTEPPNDQ